MIFSVSKINGFFSQADKFLLLALLVSFLSGIQGINWGWYNCLNPDAMAFRSISSYPPLHPGNFDKPPLLTYLNNVLINEPTKLAANAVVFCGWNKHNAESVRLHWRTILSRLLQSVFYAGSIIFCFLFAREWFGLGSARAVALLLGTCAGFVPFRIFLTADLPLVFWMMASLYFSGRIIRDPGLIRFSLLAGACAGLATATKYNGLGIAVALPLAHFLAPGGFLAAWRRPSFYLAGLAVPAAFILANPYSILDWRKFTADFMYNYTVTPVYSGETGYGYWKFLTKFTQIFGWPLSVLIPLLIVLSLVCLFGFQQRQARRAMILLVGVFALYYYQIGGFPRVETRFVLPMAPVVLLMTGPALALLSRWRMALLSLVVPLAAYGLICGWFVGRVFAEDPRMDALVWARKNIPPQAKIEAGNSPKWDCLEDKDIKVTKFPTGLQRNKTFTKTLSDNAWVTSRLSESQQKNDVNFFTEAALKSRGSDYITFDSRNTEDLPAREFLVNMRQGKYGYGVRFSGSTPEQPKWVYPQSIDFCRVSFWILGKN